MTSAAAYVETTLLCPTPTQDSSVPPTPPRRSGTAYINHLLTTLRRARAPQAAASTHPAQARTEELLSRGRCCAGGKGRRGRRVIRRSPAGGNDWLVEGVVSDRAFVWAGHLLKRGLGLDSSLSGAKPEGRSREDSFVSVAESGPIGARRRGQGLRARGLLGGAVCRSPCGKL